jgi:hypothetical protein
VGKFYRTPACYVCLDKSDKYHVTTASVGKTVTEVTNPREEELCNERLSLGVVVVFITLTCHDVAGQR